MNRSVTGRVYWSMDFGQIGIRLRSLEWATRPEPPELKRALDRRWGEIPDAIRTPNQFLGRRATGCEGTHGVFPRCNLACTPCYHSKDSNRVRTDGRHTTDEVDGQMQLAREVRGPGQAAQLIGGEVTLLGPDAHAEALETMIKWGRKPMSMTHGDFDYEYLESLALDPATGKPRFRHLSFAGHFDMTMHGRRGIRKVREESELNPYRARFCEMFVRLEREHGVTSFLAHNMTVTPGNVDQIPDVISACREMGFRMFSFQPAAFVGSSARWKEAYRDTKDDYIWDRIEKGTGGRLHPGAIQWGDPRCNRTAYGGFTGECYWTLFDQDDQRDMKMRDLFLGAVGGTDFTVGRGLLAAKLLRGALREPRVLLSMMPFLLRLSGRMGGLFRMLRHRPVSVTFVMHSFMDAAVVKPAWEAMEKGEVSEEPEVRAAQERLQGCMYGMAHPEQGRMVPACVQHSVFDPQENSALARLLPLEGGSSDA